MQNIKVKIKKLVEWAVLPSYAHGPAEDAGMDLVVTENARLNPNVPVVIGTGLQIELPPGYEAQIRSRGGMASKGIIVANQPGTVDPGYRGELKVLMVNVGLNPYEVKIGDRVAQMVVAKYEAVEWDDGSEKLTETERGEGRLGSTGWSK